MSLECWRGRSSHFQWHRHAEQRSLLRRRAPARTAASKLDREELSGCSNRHPRRDTRPRPPASMTVVHIVLWGGVGLIVFGVSVFVYVTESVNAEARRQDDVDR